MTLPVERTRVVVLTEKFLLDLTNPNVTPRIPKGIRVQAKLLLRHYPSKYDLDLTSGLWENKLFECPFGKTKE